MAYIMLNSILLLVVFLFTFCYIGTHLEKNTKL